MSAWVRSGPRPLTAVSGLPVNFTLMRLCLPPSSSSRRWGQPRSSSRSRMACPMCPAAKPSALVSMPRRWSMMDTLIPFPPG